MGSFATGSPLLPPGLIGGTLNVSATSGPGGTSQLNTPVGLLTLIQQQHDGNCPGAAGEIYVTVDGSIDVYFGTGSTIAGALSTANYGMVLGGGPLSVGTSYTFRTSFPGNSSPLGNLQVFCTVTTTLHVVAVL